MPHKVGQHWEWGNIKRDTQEELVRTVYGIWQKNGAKGKFEDFWKTGKTTAQLAKGAKGDEA